MYTPVSVLSNQLNGAYGAVHLGVINIIGTPNPAAGVSNHGWTHLIDAGGVFRGDVLLLEDGDALLLEDDCFLLLET